MNSLPFVLTVEAIAGDYSADVAIIHLASLAERVGCFVKCDLNGIETYADPHTSYEDLYEKYLYAREHGFKIAITVK